MTHNSITFAGTLLEQNGFNIRRAVETNNKKRLLFDREAFFVIL